MKDHNIHQGKPNRYSRRHDMTTREWVILVVAIVSIFGFLYMAGKVNEKVVIPPPKNEGGINKQHLESTQRIIKLAGLPNDFVWSQKNRFKYAKDIEKAIKKIK